MKKGLITLLFVVIASLVVKAQITESGQIKIINGGSVIFQKVYDNQTGNIKQKVINLLKTGPFTDIDTSALTARLINYKLNFQKFGYSIYDAAIYMRGTWSGNAKIEVKENRYRVTVSNLITKSSIEINYGAITDNATDLTYEECVVKQDGTLKKGQLKGVEIMDSNLSDLFTVYEVPENENW